MNETCTVYFRDESGRKIGGKVVSAASVFEAGRKALDFFESADWHGARPKPETVLEIKAVSQEKRGYLVPVRTLRRHDQSRLFPPDPIQAL